MDKEIAQSMTQMKQGKKSSGYHNITCHEHSLQTAPGRNVKKSILFLYYFN